MLMKVLILEINKVFKYLRNVSKKEMFISKYLNQQYKEKKGVLKLKMEKMHLLSLLRCEQLL